MARKHNDPVVATVAPSLAHDGSGVVKIEDKVYFVDGALPGEEILFTPMRKKRGRFSGRLEEVRVASPDRVEAPCEYFGLCGGCVMQHLAPAKQIEFKAQTLKDNLQRIGHVEPEEWLEPMQASLWHYRRKARPGIKLVPKKGGVLIGFRERGTSYITSLKSCLTLDKRLSDLLPAMHELIETLSCPDRIPQVEVAGADNVLALVLRHLDPLTADDLMLLAKFAEASEVQLFLQSGGPSTVHALWPEKPEALYYELPEFDLKMQFRPSDFIQVNGEINQRMIATAISYLELTEGDKVLDLFCGLGNFTLPVARAGVEVMGIEGEQDLVNQAILNTELNQINNAKFSLGDLHLAGVADSLPQSGYNKLLLDPPRSGAMEIVKSYVPRLKPERIVYVSCNPATLARDAEILLQAGYRLSKAGAIDMFPHTAHVESIAVFDRQ